MMPAALFILVASGPVPACIPVETEVTLAGKAYHRKMAGPPTYGEVPAVDVVEHITFLDLDRPISVCADGEFRDVDVGGVETLQLGLPKEIRAGRITVKGKLFFSHTGHHYAQVLMEVAAVHAKR